MLRILFVLDAIVFPGPFVKVKIANALRAEVRANSNRRDQYVSRGAVAVGIISARCAVD